VTPRSSAPADISALRTLIASATCVLFDFDGPLARLFAGRPASLAADLLKERLVGWGLLPTGLETCDDPIKVLRDTMAALRGSPHHKRVAELEALLTEQELAAVATAVPTPYADVLVQLLVARDRRVAVTTNNSAAAAARYLIGRGLGGCFGAHVHGRTADPSLMKPDPDCLERALGSTGADRARCLMIGDSPDDYLAATRARVAFVGYARDDVKAKLLRTAGARTVVHSLEELHQAALLV
jgi:phosphoglycolate phosphatase-like HAD superfamily hydrolase